MKSLLISLIISFSSVLFGQNKVLLFEDYRNCTTGFKNLDGKVIHEAIFNSVKDIRMDLENSTIFYYKVQYDGYVGLLNTTGEVVIPWKYDRIDVILDSQFIVSQNGRYGMIDQKNTILIDFKYDFLEMPGANIYTNPNRFGKNYINLIFNQTPYYYFTVNGKKGMLNEHFVERIPAKFESIQKVLLDINGVDFSQGYYFRVNNDGLVGALDSTGVEILPVEFTSVDVIKVPNTQGEFIPCFLLKDANQKLTIRTFQGKHFLQEGYTIFQFARKNNDDYSESTITSAIGRSEDGVLVYNFFSDRSFPNLLNAMPFQNYVLFEDKSGWGIIDDKGNVITKGNKEIPSVFEGELQGFPDHEYDEYSYYEESFYAQRLDPKNDIIHISHPHKFKKYTDRNGITYLSVKKMGLKGVMNFRTGAKIPMKYRSVSIKKELGETYYWAILPYKSKVDAHVSIDIYDDSMSFVRQINVIPPYDPHYEIYNRSLIIESDYTESTYPKLFIVQENNLVGAYNFKGELVLPFEYDRIHLEPWNSQFDEKSIAYYKLVKNKKIGLLDKNLNTLLPIEFDQVSFNNRLMVLWTTKDGENSIHNLDGSIRVDQFSEYYYKPLLLYDGSKKKREDNSEMYTYYFKRNGKLYVMENDTITLMDSTRIKFHEPIITLFDLIKLNKNGQFISDLSIFNRTLPDDLGHFSLQDQLLQIADENWTLRLTLPGVSGVRIYENKLIASHVDRSSSVIDLKKMEVEFKTAFPAFLFPFQGIQRTLSGKYWILPLDRYPQGTRDRWAICDSQGKLLDSLFEYPTVLYTDVTRKNGKCGLLDVRLNQLLPYEYDFISLIRGTYLLKKDGLWGTYNPKTGILNEPKYVGISIFELTNGNRIVSNGMEFGVADQNFNLIVPMKSYQQLSTDSLDLYKLLLGNDNSYAHYFGAFDTSTLPQAYRQISNENILRNVRNYNTNNQILELAVTKQEPSYSWGGRIENNWCNWLGSSETNSIFCYKNNYYSEERSTKKEQRKPGNIQLGKEEIETTEKNLVRINYKINGESIEQLELRDLFANPDDAHVILNDLLTTLYTENQAFGLTCPNIDAIVADANDDFIIAPSGIRLYSTSAPKGSVFLSKEVLLLYLLDKKMFD